MLKPLRAKSPALAHQPIWHQALRLAQALPKKMPATRRRPQHAQTPSTFQKNTASTSDDFLHHRPYQNTDPVRRIDWRQSARKTDVLVKQFNAYAFVKNIIALDTSRSMHYRSKRQHAVILATALAIVWHRQSQKIEPLSTAQPSAHSIKTQLTPQALCLRLCRQSQKPTPFPQPLSHYPPLAPYSRVLVLSDFLFSPPELQPLFDHAQRNRSHIILFHIEDEHETTFPFTQATQFIDPENRTSQTLYQPTDARTNFLHNRNQHIHQLKSLCRFYHASYMSYNNSMSMLTTLITLITMLDAYDSVC